MKKEKYINSRHLRIAQGNGDIDIRISTKESKKQQKNIIKKDDSAVDMEKIKNDIIKEMKKEFKNIGQKEDSLSKKDLVEIMTEVIKKLPKEKITIIREKGIKEGEFFDDEKVEIDEELLGEINKRAVEKMVKNVKSREIKYKEEKQKSDIEDSVSELENLLGQNMSKEVIKYNKNGKIVYYKGIDGSEAWSAYDKNNNMIYNRQSNGCESWSKYDENNRDIYFKTNDGREEWFKYNKNGEKIDITDEKLKEKEYLSRKKVSRFELMEI